MYIDCLDHIAALVRVTSLLIFVELRNGLVRQILLSNSSLQTAIRKEPILLTRATF